MSASRLPSITASADGDPRQQSVRLGVIDYLNVAPVYDAMRRDASLLPGVELVAGVPSAMNAALLAGEIDLSNVSSVAYGQHADEWLLVPGLSVAAQEKVESVLLFSWHADWRALDGGSIALSSDSATSVALVTSAGGRALRRTSALCDGGAGSGRDACRARCRAAHRRCRASRRSDTARDRRTRQALCLRSGDGVARLDRTAFRLRRLGGARRPGAGDLR